MDLSFIILIAVVFISITYNVYLHYQRIRSYRTEDLFMSVNYLLNRQTHEAVDVFKKRVTDKGYNFETYLALGNLYRHEGKLDEAIHVHETIIAQKLLKRSFRYRALYELATDYLQAGILDKAEQIFVEISSLDTYQHASRSALLDIYQQLSDWPRAIEIAWLLCQSDQRLKPLIMHFHCEMIHEALTEQRYGDVLAAITIAHDLDPKHPRLMTEKIRYFMEMKCYRLALESIHALCHIDPSYLILTYQWIYNCCHAQRRDHEAIIHIVPLLQSANSTYITLTVCQFLLQHVDAHMVFDQVVSQVLPRCDLPACLATLYSATITSNYTHLSPTELLSVLSLHIENKQPYNCPSCGFSSQSFYWKCPGCSTWGTKLASC